MIETSYNLKEITSFKIGGPAEFYTEIKNTEELTQAINFAKEKNINITILGSASNVIVSDAGIKGLVIRFINKNIEIIEENNEFSILKADSGCIWDDFVEVCVNKNLHGVENLSHIPGTVGASPIQNIGAYGQQASDSIKTVHAYDLKTNEFVDLSAQECKFNYRESIFNKSEKGRYIVHAVSFKLFQEQEFKLGYKDLAYFRNEDNLTVRKIRDEIINIRDNKIPNYNKVPNAGSFFKNVELNKSEFEKLLEKASLLENGCVDKIKTFYNEDKELNKIPTALLIDICGLKGFKWENIGVSKNHALILTNHSQKGTSKELIEFSDLIINKIQQTFGITIEREPTFLQ